MSDIINFVLNNASNITDYTTTYYDDGVCEVIFTMKDGNTVILYEAGEEE